MKERDDMFKTLIVDDEKWMCEGLKNMIHEVSEHFYVSSLAYNGHQALQRLDSERFDLIITDLMMPLQTGIELLHEIRAAGSPIEAVIISGYSEFEYAKKALQYDVSDYLLKPINRSELAAVLSKLQRKLNQSSVTDKQRALLDEGEASGQKGSYIIKKIMNELQTADLSNITVGLLAEQYGFNPSYFSRLFKAETGKGFSRYLTEVRIRKSQILLRFTGLNISEIAARIGYTDEKHFSKMFKGVISMTPTEYRRLHQQEEESAEHVGILLD
ncbi:response regulator transcription factor [Paenibacillus chungangensis]|uniref:Response regulator n=1 Tax=Paenibacillus chungangensis TaxID=696535 RepID=A0ABW3HQE5_9BACL